MAARSFCLFVFCRETAAGSILGYSPGHEWKPGGSISCTVTAALLYH